MKCAVSYEVVLLRCLRFDEKISVRVTARIKVFYFFSSAAAQEVDRAALDALAVSALHVLPSLALRAVLAVMAKRALDAGVI